MESVFNEKPELSMTKDSRKWARARYGEQDTRAEELKTFDLGAINYGYVNQSINERQDQFCIH